MKAHIDAIRAALAPLGHPTFFVEATSSPNPPYLLLWTSAGSLSLEAPVCDLRLDLDTQVGVTHVAGTPEGVLMLATSVRAALAPGGMAPLTVPGRSAWLRLEDSRPVAVDRDITLTGTNRHPAYGVDLYRLISTPT